MPKGGAAAGKKTAGNAGALHSVAVDVQADAPPPAAAAPPTPGGDVAPAAKLHDAKAAAAAQTPSMPFSRNRVALAAVGLAVTVGISAGVATLVASAIVSGAREERIASFPDGTQSGTPPALAERRLEDPSSIANFIPIADDAHCLDATEGEMCHRLVTWIVEDGARFDPGRYANVTRSTPFHEAQEVAHKLYPGLCPRPCGKQPTPPKDDLTTEAGHDFINCDYGHGDSKPAHAGCFVVHNGKLLAERLTYDHNKFDIPGGQSDWREPGRCTAFRETYEETGYLVAPRELLAVVRNGFHLYRCELLRPNPVKGHDHEISWVGWLDAHEIHQKLDGHMWRFPEASRYEGWIR